MDSFAALALATDPPTEDLLNRYPESKKSPLITIPMMKMIIGQAIFQVTAGLICYYQGPKFFRLNMTVENDYLQNGTFVFNTFVFMQLFNECKSMVSLFLNIT